MYTTPTKVMTVFPDSQPSQGAVSPDLILTAITWAESTINAYLAGRYALPLPAAVPLLEYIATDLAAYFIWTARPFTPPPRTVETQWPKRYDDAIALLVQIQAGELILVTDDGTVVPPSGAGGAFQAGAAWSNTQPFAPTFSEADDRRSVVDRNKLDYEASRRV